MFSFYYISKLIPQIKFVEIPKEQKLIGMLYFSCQNLLLVTIKSIMPIDNTLNSLQYYLYEESTFPPTMITSYVTSNSNSADFNYFFWNDDLTVKDGESKSAPSSRAHAKGSLVYDKSNGAFLLHSLPRFPTRTSTNEILTELPSNAGSYGQHFLCITVSKTTSEKIAELLNYINISNNASVSRIM